MADKSTVTFKMSAESAAFVQACEQARQKLQATADTARSAGGAVTTMGDKATKALQGITRDASSVVFGMVGIGSAVGLLANNFSAGLDRMKEKSDRLRDSLTSIEDVLYKLNRMQDLPAIRARLDKIADGVTTREGAEGIHNAVAGQMGRRASEEQTLAAVAASMGVIKGGGSLDSAAEFAKSFAELRTMKGKMEGRSDADVSELAALVQESGEALGDKELKFIAKSSDPLKAMDFILAGRKSHENPKAMESLISKATEAITPEDIRGAHGAERARLTRNAAIPVDDRTLAWMSDPTLAPAAQRADVTLINSNLGTEAESALKGKPFAGREAKFQDIVATNPAVAAQNALRLAEVGKAKSKERGEVQAITDEAVWAHYEQMMREGKIGKGLVGQFLPPSAVVAADRVWYSLNAGGYEKSADPNTWDPIVQKFESAKRDMQGGKNDNSQYNIAPMGSPPQIITREHMEALNRNTAATERNTQSNNGGPALKNDSLGQQ